MRAAHRVWRRALSGVGPQGGVGERWAAAADGAGPLQQVLQAGREGDVAGVDGVLGVADEMGEADLMVAFGPAHLGAVAIGDPEVGTDVAEEVRDHVLAAAGADDEAAVVAVMEDPGPPVPLADPHAGLVRLQHAAGEQAGADQARLAGEGVAAVVEHVDQRAFADLEPEQVGHQPRQPLERDGMGEAQVDDKGPQVRPERRAWRHVVRRLRLELPGATRAGSTKQRNARHVGPDRRDLDMVIGVTGDLRRPERRRHNARRRSRGHPAASSDWDAADGARRGAACALSLGRLLSSPEALCPCEGGVLELSGVFGGRPSLASSAA